MLNNIKRYKTVDAGWLVGCATDSSESLLVLCSGPGSGLAKKSGPDPKKSESGSMKKTSKNCKYNS